MTSTYNDRQHIRRLNNPLTPTQTLLLQQIANGYSRRDIARKRGVSEETIKTHFRIIRAKTGRRSVLLAVVMALRAKWIT